MQDYARIARKTTLILFAAQSLASAGFIAGSTINAIVGEKLGGGAYWAGVPSAVYLLGGALAASAWGFFMEIFGRRKGISLGMITGAAGSALVIISINTGMLVGFLIGMVMMGVANAAIVLGRFAAAEINPQEKRGAAISSVVLGGTIGSVVGPLVVGPAGQLAKSYGLNEFSGIYATSSILFALAAIIVFLGLRPDPRDVGRELARLYPEANQSGNARPILEILRQPLALTALLAMVLGQVVMTAVMVITSVHMINHQHMLTDISAVISAHTFGMYAFSVISGRLADKWGRLQVILIGAAVLMLATITAPLSPDVMPLAVSLFLLGLGWNFCFVAGSTLLADQLSSSERARTQGANDLLVGLASAVASLSSGLVYASLGYGLVAAFGTLLAFIPMVMAGISLWKRSHQPVLQPQDPE
ncbi:MAG TPA: MFS transporter [Anaerolineales bacterium]